MRRLRCVNTNPTLLHFSCPIPSANKRKLKSLLVNSTPRLLSLALIYTRLYPVLFPLRRVPRFQPKTFINKNISPFSQHPRPSPSPLFIPLSLAIYLVPIQMPKRTFPQWPQLPNGPTALHGKFTIMTYDKNALPFTSSAVLYYFRQTSKKKLLTSARRLQSFANIFYVLSTPATIQLAPSHTWNTFPTNEISLASRSTTILIFSQPHNSNPSTFSNHRICQNISTHS